MRTVFTGRKAHLTPTLKKFAETKLSKLNRVLDEIREIHVILEREKHRHVAEIVVRAREKTLTATGVGSEFHDAIGRCVDRLTAQAKRHRGRLQTRRMGRGAWTASRRNIPELEPAFVDDDGEETFVRMGRVALKAMSVEEALRRVRDGRRPIMVFRDEESQRVAVLFKRSDGQIGLVETES